MSQRRKGGKKRHIPLQMRAAKEIKSHSTALGNLTKQERTQQPAENQRDMAEAVLTQ